MKAYTTIGVIVGLLIYAGCIVAGGPIGFLFGWIPAAILGAIWPLPVGAVALLAIGLGLATQFVH